MPSSLSEGIEVQAIMFPNDPSIEVDDLARGIRHVMAKELAHFDVPDEADPLTVFFTGGGQSEPFRFLPNLGLQHFTDREERMTCLPLRHQCQEIGLVLVGVGPTKNHGFPVRILASPGVVPGGYLLKPLCERIIQEDSKFHLPVAENVGVRGDSRAVAFQEVVYNPLAVVIDQVDNPKLYPKFIRNRGGILEASALGRD